MIRRALWAAAGLGVALGALLLGSAAHIAAASKGGECTADEVPVRDVGLVLGAQMYADGTPSPFLKARLDLGAQLLASGKVKALVASGDNRESSNHEADAMRAYLIASGVDPGKVVADPYGYDTYDSCVRLKEVYGVTSVTLVSQGYHLPRALTICRAVGLDAVAVGDYTRRYTSNAWAEGETREWFAAVKMEWDIWTRRRPVLGDPDPALHEAINR